MELQQQSKDQELKLTAIDRALALAKARKEAKAASEGSEHPVATKTYNGEPKTKKALSQLKEEERKKAREEKRAQRELHRAAKAAAREANAAKRPTHMKKVENALSRLPKLDEATQDAFNDLTNRFSVQQLNTLSLHLQVHNRATLTLKATKSPPLPLGSTVRITGGDPRFVGLTGEVVHSQKLRAKIKVPGLKNTVYVYSCEAETTQPQSSAAE